MQLSKYFTLEQLTHSNQAESMGVDNTPDTFAQGNLQRLAALLDQIYDQVGPFTITSGYRSPALNAALADTSTTSLHMRGMAADLAPESMTPDEFFLAIIHSGIRNLTGEIINEGNDKGVIHVSLPYEAGTGIAKYLENGQYYRYADQANPENNLYSPSGTEDDSTSAGEYEGGGGSLSPVAMIAIAAAAFLIITVILKSREVA